jgi:GGDEF domain-containing protein
VRGRGSLLLPLAILPLFAAIIVLTTAGMGIAGLLAILAPASFYFGYASLMVRRRTIAIERRQARFEAEVRRRIEELDPQTAAISRQNFETALGQEIRRSKRHKLPLCVVTLALPPQTQTPNRAVYTTDLVQLAARALRAEDSIARLSRNLFAISLPHTTPPGANVVIDRIARELGEPQLEFGIAYLPAGRYVTAERLVEMALASPADALELAA